MNQRIEKHIVADIQRYIHKHIYIPMCLNGNQEHQKDEKTSDNGKRWKNEWPKYTRLNQLLRNYIFSDKHKEG